ncbi:uncharacterized protein PITG_09142 [Phytophthora infestans T30-4]|uniref:Uncharacterized protein n=1 Tax=Phytophthora infestans (strain T30-4) TaxID=403677 RepID=D0NBT3_PHYIT|nr:uncharacterized protein PITG_09142 [Phytophthora infestans T30-4]EEY55238.1 hypothetical protein PITG_09142 [Phytophthora infestans T30-4]|eukprot:XP_002903462.1 hypothetical protein PITG_09142 [Phytophthora infestans T30-4]
MVNIRYDPIRLSQATSAKRNCVARSTTKQAKSNSASSSNHCQSGKPPSSSSSSAYILFRPGSNKVASLPCGRASCHRIDQNYLAEGASIFSPEVILGARSGVVISHWRHSRACPSMALDHVT